MGSTVEWKHGKLIQIFVCHEVELAWRVSLPTSIAPHNLQQWESWLWFIRTGELSLEHTPSCI